MKNLKKIIGFFICIISWETVSVLKDTPAIPSFAQIFKKTIQLLVTKEYLVYIKDSMSIVVTGILIAIFFGIVLGILVFEFKTIKEIVMPVIDTVRGISGLTLLPLLIILVGIESPSRIIVIFWTAWPAIMLSTIHSLDIDKNITEAASLDGAIRIKMLTQIKLPIASHGILTGIRIGCSGGWISLIAAEMLGATSGLGYFLLYSSQAFLFTNVYATIIIIAVLGGLMNLGLSLIQNRLKKYYEGSGKREKIFSNRIDFAIGNSVSYGVRQQF